MTNNFEIGDIVISKAGRDEGKVYQCHAIHVDNVVDTTAAGDYFAAGFLHALSQGGHLKECLQAGTILATEAIQVVGSELGGSAWNRIKTALDCK